MFSMIYSVLIPTLPLYEQAVLYVIRLLASLEYTLIRNFEEANLPTYFRTWTTAMFYEEQNENA